MRLGRLRLAVTGLLLGLLALALGSATVAAQETFTIRPEYLHITQEAGRQVSTIIHFQNLTDEPLALSLDFAEAPGDPWDPFFKPEFISYRVQSLLLGPTEERTLQLVVDIPQTARGGDYDFTIRARTADGQTEQVTVTLTVRGTTDEGDGTEDIEMESRFPLLTGPTGSEFEFQVTFRNKRQEPVILDLSADAPENWDVRFKPSFEDKLISSVSLEAGQNQIVKMLVTPPNNADPGDYQVAFLVSGPNVDMGRPFGVRLTGTKEMALGTTSGRLNIKATAGKETVETLVVVNRGTGVLRQIRLVSQAPSGWEVTFDPPAIDVLTPEQQLEQVTARIKPPEDAIAGDYQVTLRSSSPDAAARTDLRVSVTGSTVWGWVGLAVVVVVVGGLVGLFVKLGRR